MAELHLVDEYGFLGGVGGSCALCNASKRTTDRPERIVTTNLVTDMEDAPAGVWPEKYMEFCETCICEMGRLVGMVSENEAQNLVAQIEQQDLDKMALRDEIEQLKLDLKDAVSALKFVPTPTVASVKK